MPGRSSLASSLYLNEDAARVGDRASPLTKRHVVARLDAMFDKRSVSHILIIHRDRIQSSRQYTNQLVANSIADRDELDFQLRQQFAGLLAPSLLLVR